LDKQNTSTIEANFQTDQNRVMRAALFVAEGSLLLRQESVELLGCRNATRLREISDGLQQLVPALNRLGRAIKPPVIAERIPPMSSAALDECVTAGGAL